ncbi:MAG: hypothetical protein BWY83_02265 [bacterium ADurb.Bin478]|nr:MAG: hypothetical protein BWY83_02265 [bacterium ADurb.Bin478]
MDSGIQVLAHPFRVFRKAKREVPRDLFQPLARLLKENGVAAEINFHTNQPDPDFFRICMEEMTPIVLGSDAHNLYEIGEFMPHLSLLAGIGMSSRQLHRPSVEFSGECRESPWDPRNGCSLI